MRNMGRVQGHKSHAVPLTVDKDTVYIRSDFTNVLGEDGEQVDELIEYSEIQYDKDEFIEKMVSENDELKIQLDSTNAALMEFMMMMMG